jgi:hypothetical protein
MELEHALERFLPGEAITPEINDLFNSLLDLARVEKPNDPVLLRIYRTEVDMATFYLGSDQLRSCGTALAQLGQMLIAVEDPDEYEPPSRKTLLTLDVFKALREQLREELEKSAGEASAKADGEDKEDDEPPV